MTTQQKVPRRIAQTVLNSLKGGVVPRIGLPYITVGRKHEIEALLRDVEIISEGGASFRFIVGRYGSGKSFLLQTIRNYVMAGHTWSGPGHVPGADRKPVHKDEAGGRRASPGSGPVDQRRAE